MQDNQKLSLIYLASTDADTWHDDPEYQSDSIDGAIAAHVYGYDLKVGDRIFVGRLVYHGAGEKFYPGADKILDDMINDAAESADGDVGADWMAGVTKEQEKELQEALHSVLKSWIEKYSLQPSWWTAENVSEYRVEERHIQMSAGGNVAA